MTSSNFTGCWTDRSPGFSVAVLRAPTLLAPGLAAGTAWWVPKRRPRSWGPDRASLPLSTWSASEGYLVVIAALITSSRTAYASRRRESFGRVRLLHRFDSSGLRGGSNGQPA